MKKGFSLIELMIVVCIVAILSAIAVPNFVEAETRADVAQVREDLRRVSMGLSGYYVDYRKFPSHYPFLAATGYVAPTGVTKNINRAVQEANGDYSHSDYIYVPSFAAPRAGGGVIGLTTPVAYLSQYPHDEFTRSGFATFAFAAGMDKYLLWSRGPDYYVDQLDGGTSTGSGQNAAEYIVRGNQPLPSPYLIAGPMSLNAPSGAPANGTGAFSYDPTNGTSSYGDIWRVRRGAI